MSSRRIPVLAVVVIGLLAWSPDLRLSARAAQQPAEVRIGGLTPAAIAQIDSLMAEKRARTPVQLKIDSQLLHGAKVISGRAIAAGVPTLQVTLPMTADNRVVLDVRAPVSAALLARLRALGADVTGSNARYRHVGVRAPLNLVEAIAAIPEVVHVAPALGWMTSRSASPELRTLTGRLPDLDRTALTKAGRPDLMASLRRALQSSGPRFQSSDVITNTGTASSQGDTTHRAAEARSSFGVSGSGVKIGVLSDGVNSLSSSQASGNLGPVTILPGQAGSGDEGTAMLEIVADLAPGAQLYFATATFQSSMAQFAQNIRDLRAAGCDIIVDDVFYFVESAFQDGQTATSPTNGGIVIQAVKDVAASGALYFSSAGNSGNLDAGTSGTWEGDFVDGGDPTFPLPPGVGRIHNFGSATFNTLLASGGAFNTLYWSDPVGWSTNDYDLLLLDSTGNTVKSISDNPQTGTHDPFEAVGPGSAGDRLVIVKYSGATRYLHLSTNRGRLAIATAGQTHGHAATSGANTFGVAATPACGPCSTSFTGSSTVEIFSSDGPRRIFYDGTGAAITPGNFSATGGQVLAKPDITAADGVATTVPGFSSFFGTSAAAPHAAGIAALVKSANLSRTAAQVSAALTATAIDIHGAGVDRDSGFGIVMAFQAVSSVPLGGDAPVVTRHPTSKNVLTGQSVALSAATSGAAAAQWQVSSDAGVTWTNIPGATFFDLVFNAQRSDNGKQYRCVFTNISGSAATTAATVLVRYRVPADLDGDRKADLMIWRPSSGFWYWLTSSADYGTATGKQWGSSGMGDIPLSGDMDGDGLMDLIVWRPADDRFYWLTSGSGFTYAAQQQKQWGSQAQGDIPMVGDIDGDGKAELIVWRPATGTWFWLPSSSGYSYAAQRKKDWGSQSLGDKPLLGDFDGDGLVDLTVWRASTGFWYSASSSSGYETATGRQWGDGSRGDIPLIGDFDADGITDLTVWRPADGTFYWVTSTTGYSYASQGAKQWGTQLESDVPMVADLDGDGRAELIVWRPASATWFWLTAASGYNYAQQVNKTWGTLDDIPMIR